MCSKWKTSVLALPMLFLLSSNSFAGEDNFGLYKRIGQDATSTYWELQWTTYLPEAAEEEPMPGDVPIQLEGGSEGGCSSDPLPGNELCALGETGDMSVQTITSIGPVTLPPIVVTGVVALSRSWMLAYIPASATGGSSGGSSGSTFPTGVGIGRPEELGLCDTGDWENITDEVIRRAFLTPRVLEGLRELVNRSQAEEVETAGRIVVERRPASDAFSVRFESASEFADSVSETCTSVRIGASPLTDFSNSILVHTHGDWCADPGSTPSSQDRQALRDFNFMGGVILDLASDRIISFGPDEPDEDPGEQETLCGISE
ncbi:MAG: hypothetical protein WD397_08735 [Wenzhouxiangellaceae bacterium]